MKPIPTDLTSPFTRDEARRLGLTDRMLTGRRFVRVFPRVYRHRDHAMSHEDWVTAARLTLPGHARLTGISRIQQLGLDFGARFPVRFVVEGDLHLDIPEIFLHRTRRMPPTDDVGVTPAAAFIAYCRRARVLDALKVGDWLLHHGWMSIEELQTLALAEQWRDGADEALWMVAHLDAGSRSLAESECRALLGFAGLPVAEANRRLTVADDATLLGDVVFQQWRTVVEYEGTHHQTDRDQYNSDIDRFAILRRNDIGYVQATKEKLHHPRTFVGEVYRELVSRGYDGPSPSFGGQWQLLFMRVTDVLGPKPGRRQRTSGGWDTAS